LGSSVSGASGRGIASSNPWAKADATTKAPSCQQRFGRPAFTPLAVEGADEGLASDKDGSWGFETGAVNIGFRTVQGVSPINSYDKSS
jgi:hypothetical protein